MTDELLVKYLLNECDNNEIALVSAWLDSHPANQTYFNQLKQVWDDSKLLYSNTNLDVEQAWRNLQIRIKKAPLHYTNYFYYIAAAIVLLIGIFSLYKLNHKENKTIPTLVQTHESFIESKLTTRIDTLSDQSIVTLNKNAILKYPSAFTHNERRVQLKGEAFFNITPNKEKPFFIDASNDVEIKVLGTSFNVKSYANYTEVVVETGIVEVRRFNKVMLLHPFEKARIDKEDSTIVVQKNKDKLYKYYRSKEFECDNTPLWKVVEVLNEAYGDSILIGRKELRSLSLTTRFDNESLESILDIISETFELKVEKHNGKYILK